ncbi:hypothetical protein B0T18DRAFT_62894 [Schizothecium vesticola]|uniref:Uncharacterized protein n=1 Tax=Schizothecium vesticola TaxID=314040 RepID=A0AA40F4Y8_9PEZI|nr:hypothetical protein B0T18DRAFT_62894 [Schizothecium vesticola]
MKSTIIFLYHQRLPVVDYVYTPHLELGLPPPTRSQPRPSHPVTPLRILIAIPVRNWAPLRRRCARERGRLLPQLLGEEDRVAVRRIPGRRCWRWRRSWIWCYGKCSWCFWRCECGHFQW